MSRTHVSLLLLILSYIGFISLGLPDALHGIAWPRVREEFGLHQGGLGFILACGGSGYLLSSFYTGKLLRLMHVGTLLFVSTALVSVGLLGYALINSWSVFLGSAAIIGMGSGAIDGGLNSFASKNFSAKHMTWLHGCYGVGASLGPIIMTQAVAAGRWQQGFLIVGLILLVLTIVFGISRRRWNQFVVVEQSHEHSPVSLNAAIKNKKVILQALIFFFYVGAEATVGQWSFTLNSEHRGMPLKVAGAMTVLFWASLTCGRFLMGFLVGKMGSVRLLRLSIGSSLGGALLFTLPFAWTSAVAMMVLGFSLAAIYPLLMSETPHRVGKAFTDHAVGLQVSVAVVGLMVIPSAGGILSEKFGLQVIPFLAVAVIAILLVLNKAVETRS